MLEPRLFFVLFAKITHLGDAARAPGSYTPGITT